MDTEKILSELINIAQQGVRQTRDGTHFEEENIKKEIDAKIQILNQSMLDFAEIAKKSEKDIDKETKQIASGLKKLNISGAEAEAIAKDINKRKKDARLKSIDALNNYTKLKTESEKQYRNTITKEAIRNIASSLTQGKSDKYLRFGEDMQYIGRGLKNIYGEKSLRGKIGSWIEKQGTNLNDPKSAFKAGATEMIVNGVADAVSKGFDLAISFLKISMQENSNDFNYLTAETQNKAELANLHLAKGYTFKDKNGKTVSLEGTEILQKRAQGEASYETALNNADLARHSAGLNAEIQSFSNITDSVYSALEAETHYQYAKKQADLEREYSIGDTNSSLSVLKEKNSIQSGETENVLQKKLNVSGVSKEREQTKIDNARNAQWATGVGAVAGGIIAGVATAYSGGTAAASIPSLVGGGAAAGGALGRGWAELKNTIDDSSWQLREQAQKLNQQSAEIHQNYVNQTQDAISTIKDTSITAQKEIKSAALKTEEEEKIALINFTKDLDKKFEEAEKSANSIGISLGYTSDNLDNFEDSLFKTQLSISKWGKSMEDIQKLQESYSEGTGRNIQMTTDDFNKSFAMGTFWGDDTISALNQGMEIFNHSVADSNEMFYEMNKTAIKMGLNGRKFGKDLVNNMKLAEKYSFKDGVKSLLKMSLWAQNVRFNMGSLDNMVSSVQDGGLEGLIKQSAGLQVLGGNFAMGSDPLAMGYEAFNDDEAYAKRVNSMLKGLGFFNSQNGEVEVRGANRMIANQAAKLLGMSTEDVIKQIKQDVKINQISGLIGNGFNEEQQAMIANKAQYVDGSWKVNLGNQKDENGNDVLTDVSDLTPDMLKSLIDDSEKTLEESAISSLSVLRNQEALQTQMVADQTQYYEEFKKEHIDRIKQRDAEYQKNRDDWHKNVSDNMKAATAASQALQDFYQSKGPADIAADHISNISGKMDAIANNVSKIAAKIGADYDIQNEDLEKVGNSQPLLKIKQTMDSMGGFDKAYKNLSVNGSTWYTDTNLRSVMNMLRADPSALLKIQDKNLQTQLARLIYEWDDDRWTQDFNFLNNKQLSDILRPYHIGNWTFHGGGETGFVNDGLIMQNGVSTRIDKNDQVLAAKEGGPLDRMLDMIQPRSMPYDSYVKETPYYNGGSSNNGEIKIAPISITINGSINVNGSSIDLSSQIQNDPNFQNALWGLISQEVSKKIGNTGKMIDPLYYRIQNTL